MDYPEAERILFRRYAAGEIEDEGFARRLSRLRGSLRRHEVTCVRCRTFRFRPTGSPLATVEILAAAVFGIALAVFLCGSPSSTADGHATRIHLTASPRASPPPLLVILTDPLKPEEKVSNTDPDLIDSSICLQQPFFASPVAAHAWLTAHPGGQAIPVAEFYHRLRGYISQTPAANILEGDR